MRPSEVKYTEIEGVLDTVRQQKMRYTRPFIEEGKGDVLRLRCRLRHSVFLFLVYYTCWGSVVEFDHICKSVPYSYFVLRHEGEGSGPSVRRYLIYVIVNPKLT